MKLYNYTFRTPLLLPVFSLLFLGCSGEKPASWALNYGTISNINDQIEGVHVWTLFDEDWDLSSDSYVCAVVQLVEGYTSSSPGGCPGATHSFNWTLTTISSDCETFSADDPFLTEGITGGCIGDVPENLVDETPHYGETSGWYILDSSDNATPHGFVYPEALDLGIPAPDEAWENGEPITLSPAWGWAL